MLLAVVYAYPPYDHAFRPDSDATNDQLRSFLRYVYSALVSIAVVSRLTSYSPTRSFFLPFRSSVFLLRTCYICPFFKMAVRGHYERTRKGLELGVGGPAHIHGPTMHNHYYQSHYRSHYLVSS